MARPHLLNGPRAFCLLVALASALSMAQAYGQGPVAGGGGPDRAKPADAATAQGAPLRYTAAYFFGASNLDTGNWQSHAFWSLDANAPRPANGYWRWRWQSGPVWAEYFAQSLGLTAQASAQGGSNYAFGAAGTSPHPGETPGAPGTPGHALYLSTQIDQVLADHPAGLDPKAIYVFAIGDNDPVIFGRTPAEAPTAAAVVITQMQRLRVAGARRFLVRTLPPGQDPYATPFNTALRQGLPALRAAGAKAYLVDAAQFVAGYLTVPYLASIGITQFGPGVNCRSNAACQAAAATAALADQVHDHAFLFFDGLGPHFNHRVHREIADHALLQLPLFENGFD